MIETDTTYHGSILEAMLAGAGRIRKKVKLKIYTTDSFVTYSIEHDLDRWTHNGFRRADGSLISNAGLWHSLAGVLSGISDKLPDVRSGGHGYYNWMISEMRRKECSSRKTR